MLEHHPYGIFIPKGTTSMIIGSFPIAKFSNPKRSHEIKPHEFEFYFGGEKNLLWRLLAEVFQKKLENREDIIKMLKEQHLGVGDVITSCRRKEGGSSDSDLYDIRWNHELIGELKKRKIQKLYFTSRQVEKWFERLFPGPHPWQTVRLLSPSAQTARSIVRMPEYLAWKKLHPQQKTYDFLVKKYKEDFNNHNS